MHLIGNAIETRNGHKLTTVCRYDLNALFNKAFSDFSVNVQGLSRVRVGTVFGWSLVVISLLL